MNNTEALREAAQAVLDRWDSPQWAWTKHGPTADLMHALRAALAQPAASGEPVAFGFPNSAITGSNRWMMLRESVPADDQYGGALWVPLYAAPQPAPARVPLTASDIGQGAHDAGYNVYKLTAFVEGARFAEAQHGITAKEGAA